MASASWTSWTSLCTSCPPWRTCMASPSHCSSGETQERSQAVRAVTYYLVVCQWLCPLYPCNGHAVRPLPPPQLPRDLKPDNVFVRLRLGSRPSYELGDVGMSKFVLRDSGDPLNSVQGNTFYMAPEMVRQRLGPMGERERAHD